jgi:hypothetical protein
MELYCTAQDFSDFKLLESRLIAIQVHLLAQPLFKK